MTVYRICRSKYPENNGAGAQLHGGRWNHKGTPILYCGATASLCALEVLANSAGLPQNMIIIAAEIPHSLPIPAYTVVDLPADWNAAVPSSITKDLGTTWAKLKTSLAISVPSAVVPDERNYLINPL